MNAIEAAVPSAEFCRTPRLLIRASAGTGKTFQLSNRYLSLLRSCPAEQILAVTFTRKAAGEILERILLRLAAAVLNDDQRTQLSGFLGGDELTAVECESLLAATVRQLHRVKVSTLDSFFSRLATSIPLEIGLPPNWSIADEHASRQVMVAAIDDVLRGSDDVTTRRLVYLLAKGIVPRSIARLMSTTVQTHYDIFRLTQADAWRRIQPPLPLSGEELEVLLVEHEQLDLSECEGIRKAHEKDVVKCRLGEWEDFLGSGPAKKLLEGETKFGRKELPAHVIDLYRRLIEQARSVLLKIWADQIFAVQALLAEFSAARKQLVAESGSLRFDDIAVALAERMRGVDSRALVHRLDGDIDHLLLDEFQDTSLLQWDVVWPFVDALDRREGTSFFCVGDVKQAIYGWRGGVAALFDKVQRDVPGVRSGMLNESRRSAPAIMSAVNRVFQNLELHPNLGDLAGDVVEWQRSFPEHSTAKLKAPGYVSLQTADAEPEGSDEKPGINGKRDRCIGRAVDIIAELITKRPDVTIGVLTRKNDMVGRVIHALAERGIPASEEGGVRLTTSAAVQLIQSLLRFADHPGDTVASYHVAHSPLGALFDIHLKMDVAQADAASLAIRRELAVQGYEAAIEKWARALDPLCNAREKSRLRRLCVLAAEYQLKAGLRPVEFAKRIDEERVEEPTASAVRVMTIHKSKGLEFDVVLLPDLDVGLFDTPDVCVGCPAPAERPDTVLIYRGDPQQKLLPPDLKRAIEQQRRTDVHEALCCLYVAMTRAAHALHMIIAPQAATQKGETTYQKTAAGLLRATLAQRPDLPPGEVLFECGDPRWFEELPAPETPGEGAPPAAARSSAEISFASAGSHRTRGRESASPSQGKGAGRSVRASQLLSIDAASGMERGTLWHLWCQETKWLDDGPLESERLRLVGRPHCRDESKLTRELKAFLKAAAATGVKDVFLRSAALKERAELGADVSVDCLTESRFTMLVEGRCVSGSIDRLVLYRRGGKVVAADVIDFKTDLAGEATPLRPAYREQVRQYASSVARTYGLDASVVRSRLVWLTTHRIEDVEAVRPGRLF
ncbi:ATP-dependent helicase/nuclease subunit A [Caulifigura coniformis]|uniref:DNA 3'-5' helicase n=1 Tax=Caulifigura coniformis TaxID=2527983 RepID=A0A517SFH7_9PLAN|nr:UvrD-helicase domain-containing protein [Caulifigura coniformis]QDT54883.1 ATP-dependent helicase/nuclease subunit A [Caulifigura coniformis]